jgi:hypothetical protein
MCPQGQKNCGIDEKSGDLTPKGPKNKYRFFGKKRHFPLTKSWQGVKFLSNSNL